MQIITPAQCRAARALLNWSQPELAQRCDVHVQTISNFEKESSTPSKTTLEKIVSTFMNEAVVFTEDQGVKLRPSFSRSYHGAEGFRAFMDDVYETARIAGGDLCLLNSKPSNWIVLLGEDWYYKVHSARMEAIADKFRLRITTREGEYNFISNRFAEYRWVPRHIWNQHSFYAYGDKIAFLNFDHDDVAVFVLTHPQLAKTHKFLFNLVWDQYSIIPDTPDHKPQKIKKAPRL